MQNAKPWYQSRVIWANLLVTLAAMLAAPEIQALLGADTLRYVVAGQAAVNIALRFVTVQPVRRRPKLRAAERSIRFQGER